MLNISHEYAIFHKYQLHPPMSVITQLVAGPYQPNPSTWSLGTNKVTIMLLEWTQGHLVLQIELLIKSARWVANAQSRTTWGQWYGPVSNTEYYHAVHDAQVHIWTWSDHLEQAPTCPDHNILQESFIPGNVASEAMYAPANYTGRGLHWHENLLIDGNHCMISAWFPLRQMGIRQLSIRYSPNQSWFAYASDVGAKYSIAVLNQVHHPWPKHTWKCRYVVLMLSI